jgi:cytochrome P450
MQSHQREKQSRGRVRSILVEKEEEGGGKWSCMEIIRGEGCGVRAAATVATTTATTTAAAATATTAAST